ncbi:MAG: acyl-CoA dehydrogenase family protein [Parvibaculaceae bacterium]
MITLDQFTDEVRNFLDEKLTPELRRAGELCAGIYADQPVALEWHRILNEQGWAVPGWPVEFGGTGWTLEQRAVFQHELTLASAPIVSPNSTRMVGPVVIAFGTEEQKAQYLPRIRSGDDWWAQGYSEPEAGSDLASLQCRADRAGDDYVINGSKIWTTHAQWSNKMFCLVRTRRDGKPQQGISFLLFDINLPGITIKPLISMSGDHEFNEVFFDNARVPASGLLGVENDGWTVAKYLLQHERGGAYAPSLKVRLRKLVAFASASGEGAGTPFTNDTDFTRKLAMAEIELDVLASFEQSLFSAVKSGEPIGEMSSAIKVRGTEMRQRLTELVLEAVAYYGFPYQPDVRSIEARAEPIGSAMAATALPQYLNDRAASIYAGSNEIQRNIMAKVVLGL